MWLYMCGSTSSWLERMSHVAVVVARVMIASRAASRVPLRQTLGEPAASAGWAEPCALFPPRMTQECPLHPQEDEHLRTTRKHTRAHTHTACINATRHYFLYPWHSIHTMTHALPFWPDVRLRPHCATATLF